MQAWLECNDLLIRAKNALYEEALAIFSDEIKKGNIAVNGKFVKFEERGVQGKEEFLMLNMLSNKDDMISFFKKSDKSTIAGQSGKLASFIRSISRIEKLVELSRVFDEWAEESLLDIKEKDSLSIIRKGIAESPIKKEAVTALLDCDKCKSAGYFSDEDIQLFSKALSYD
jgi:hypothetical protein